MALPGKRQLFRLPMPGCELSADPEDSVYILVERIGPNEVTIERGKHVNSMHAVTLGNE